MGSFLMLLVLTAIMAAVQIGIWSIFPLYIKDLIMSNPILAFIINLAGSCTILSFTGSAMLVGSANLGASIAFGGYAMLYRKKRGIVGMEWRVCKIFRRIPYFAYLRARIEPTDFKVFDLKRNMNYIKLGIKGSFNFIKQRMV